MNLEQTRSEESDWKVLMFFCLDLFFSNHTRQRKNVCTANRKLQRPLMKWGQSKAHMLFFIWRKGQWPWDTANYMTPLRNICHIRQSSENSSIRKSPSFTCWNSAIYSVHSRLNSVIQSILNNCLNRFKCHFILSLDEAFLKVQQDFNSFQPLWNWTFQSNHVVFKNKEHTLSVFTEQYSMAPLTACFFWSKHFI